MVSIISTILLLTINSYQNHYQVNALNILGIFAYPGTSHFYQFKVYLHELVKRGHNVTVISHFPVKNPIPNYHDISLEKSDIMLEHVPRYTTIYRHITAVDFLLRIGIDSCKKLVKNEQVRLMVKNKQKFDVVIVQQFNTDCGLGIAYKLDAPVVGITAGMLIHYHCNRYGVPCNPANTLSHYLGGTTTPSLYQRIERNIIQLFYTILAKIQQWTDDYTIAEYYNDVPPLEDLARDIKILLVYQNLIVSGSRLLPFNVIEVSGYHVAEAKPLTGELKKFIDEAEHGVIYISFGTLIKLSSLSNEIEEAIFEAIQEFPQRVVMKYDGQLSHIDTTKIYLSKWLPQGDILGHPKTLLFMAHGGISGIMEALHHGVPMVIMPFFSDQYANAAAIEERGFGVEIDDINKQSLISAIKQVLDPVFRAKALQVSMLFHDRPMSPLDTAVYWTEFAARNANFTFRTPVADTPLYQLLYLDVTTILIFTFFVVVYLSKKIASIVYFILSKCRYLFIRQTQMKIKIN